MKKTLLFSLVCLAGAIGAAPADYAPADWNLEARKKFAEQRFGVFVHWGLYANYAQGEWYLLHGNKLRPGKSKCLKERAYARMMYGFCPSKFDAREWARCIRGAGAKYLTITARHHDGFSLWPTKVDDGYNIALTPFKRDILGELAEACRAEGLQLNFYYSLMDWHRKDYPAGQAAREVLGNQKGDYPSYKKFMMAQIAELIDSYHPGNIWFDGEWDQAEWLRDGRRIVTLDWEFDDIYDLIHSKKTLVANNNHQAIRPKEDIQLFERDLPGENSTGFSAGQPVTRERPLEQCDVIQDGVWGYRITETKFRKPEEVVAMVARAASHDSNLLMNIGPDGSGQFPEEAVGVMREVGKWFAVNGESIYGTRAGGVACGKAVVSTRKDNVLYLHFLDPKVSAVSFKLDGEIVSATYLKGGKPASVERTPSGLVVVSIDRPKTTYDIVVKVTVR